MTVEIQTHKRAGGKNRSIVFLFISCASLPLALYAAATSPQNVATDNGVTIAITQSAPPPPPAPQNAPGPGHQGPVQGWTAQQQRQLWATQKLAKSPHRNEWVKIPNGNRTLRAWVDYPDVKEKVPVVLVLHEVFGLTDSTRNTADQIASMGYIAITPDMLSGYGPNGGNADSFEPPHSASDALTGLTNEAVNGDLSAWARYAAKLPGSNGKLAIVGLSWGGGAAFRYAACSTQSKGLKAIFVFYDVGPPTVTQGPERDKGLANFPVAAIDVNVYGFYPSKDTRVMKSLQATKDAMAAAGKFYDPVVYEDAEHAYMRVGEDPADTNPANAAAVKASLARLQKLLGNL